jgi:hypothetical protein
MFNLRHTLRRRYPSVLFLVALIVLGIGSRSRVDAQSLTATVTYPPNLATNADLTLPIQWTGVDGVDAYYLYVGSTIGARDLVNTGEIRQTSYLATNLPANQTLYARLWTKLGGIWRFEDSTFSGALAVNARITYPADGALNADLSQRIQWTTVANVQAYYLYVGTTRGAKDLVNTGETQQTSYLAVNLPANQLLYARISTKVGGVWRYIDSTFSAAPALKAQITFPADGAVADLSQPIRWTTVADAQTYYLYVGTTPGAKDLVNTGETQQTSYLAVNLPASQTLYARMHTKHGGIWRYVDSTFSVAPVLKSYLVYPADGAVSADMSQRIQWTTVPNIQAYYLYVGTTIGAKDLVNTGETLQTSYLATNLPANRTLYARMHARAGGVWRYVDSVFTASPPLKANLTYPVDAAVNADLSKPIQWTSVAEVQAYYLYVGTTLGAKDLVNTGETQQTSWLAPKLPARQTLYARMWTKKDGVWRYADTTFTAAPAPPVPATLTYPPDGAVNVDQSQPFTWTAVSDVQAYYLYVGTSPGANDLVNSGETRQTSVVTSRLGHELPSGVTLYARLLTRAQNVWTYRDSTFTALPMSPQFIYPTDGAVGVDVTIPFRWTPAANATAHELRVGTTPGGTDVFRSSILATPTALVIGAPPTGTLYARALSKVGTTWTFTDIAFTLDPSVTPSTIVVPQNGETGFDTARPFQWAANPLARGYRLTIGTAPGAGDLHDSGEIQVSRRFVPNLPTGTLFGRVETKIAGRWYPRDFTFAVGANTLSGARQVESALWATHFVRSMAASDNRPYSWTELAARKYFVTCLDYALTLVQVWTEINGQVPIARLNIALNPNGADTHALAELFVPDTQTWMILDPTFDLTVKRASDGTWATAEDVSAATRAQLWNDVSYVFLSPLGESVARAYLIDYPVLYVNVYHAEQTMTNGRGGPVMPYMNEGVMPVSGSYAGYVIGCTGVTSTSLLINDIDQTVDCSGVDGLSRVFGAKRIAPTDRTAAGVKLYQPRRYVF